MSVISKKHLLSFLLCWSLVPSASVFSQSAEQWRQLRGPSPEGASIDALFSHGDYLFAAGHNDIFRSTDQGQSWTKLGVIGKQVAINALAASEGRLFAGTSGGVFHSTDDGRSWTPINDGLTELDARGLVANDTHLFVTTYNGRLFARRL